MTQQTKSDADLIAAWLDGDKDAFAAIYDRYADGLYGFAMSRLRNRSEAADAVQETFVRAAACIDQLRDRSRLRSWLFAIARNRVIDARRRPMTYVDAEEFTEMPADQPELAEVAARSELAELVSIAAGGLTPRDRELLGLHLRHGLDGADLAAVVGVSPANLYVAMNRLKERMAKAVGALLIARHGSKDCPELSAVLAGWDGTFSLDVRSRVTRHVEGCAECTTRRAALITTASLSAGALAVPFAVPAPVRATMLGQLEPDVIAVVRRAHPHRWRQERWRPDGFPAPRRGTRRVAATTMAAAAACAVLIVASVLFVSAKRDGQRVLDPLASAPPPAAIDAPHPAAEGMEELAPIVPAAVTAVDATTGATTAGVATAVATTVAAVDVATSTSFAPITVDAASGMHPSATTPPTSPVAATSTIPGLAPTPTSPTSSPAPPAPTGPDVAPPPPGPSPDTTASATTAAATTTPPSAVPPGHLVVIGDQIDLGATAGAGSAQLRNDGAQLVAWTSSVGLAGLSVAPASGSLAAGQTVAVQISLDRAGLPEGGHVADVTFAASGTPSGTSAGGGTVTVSARVERAPVISSFVRTPATVRNSMSCGPTLVGLSLTATDESGIASVEVVWSSDGAFAQRTTLSTSGGGTYSGTIGSFSKLGTNNFTAHVLDTRGNAATAASSVVVVAC